MITSQIAASDLWIAWISLAFGSNNRVLASKAVLIDNMDWEINFWEIKTTSFKHLTAGIKLQ